MPDMLNDAEINDISDDMLDDENMEEVEAVPGIDNSALQDLVSAFLCVNDSPSDDQVHMLAKSVGTDPETLEAVVYHMLSECQTRANLIQANFVQDVLDGDYTPSMTPADDLAVNDGEPDEGSDPLQDVLNDDGVPHDENVTSIDDGTDDGVPDLLRG